MKRTLLITMTLLASLLGSERAGLALAQFHPTYGVEGTYASYVLGVDVILLASWTKSQAEEGETDGFTEFRVERIGIDKSNTIEKGQRVQTHLLDLKDFEPENRYLLRGNVSKSGKIGWFDFERISGDAFEYLLAVPKPELPLQERLPYFLKHLDSKDRFIREDTHHELMNAGKFRFADLAAIADQLPRTLIRRWFKREKYYRNPEQTRIYGLMLGLCGEKEKPADWLLLSELIYEEIEDSSNDSRSHFFHSDYFHFRSDYFQGLDGIYVGYLMLRGDDGLSETEYSISNSKNSKAMKLSAYMSALEFVGGNKLPQISRERLVESMRRMLFQPGMLNDAIDSLGRWGDWGVVDFVIAKYNETIDTDQKEEILRYLLSCADSDDREPPSRHVRVAKQALERFKDQDPEIFEKAQRSHSLIKRLSKEETP